MCLYFYIQKSTNFIFIFILSSLFPCGGDKRNELGVHKFYGISFSRKVGVKDFLTDGKGLSGSGLLSASEFGTDGKLTTFKVADSLLSNKNKVNVNSLGEL